MNNSAFPHDDGPLVAHGLTKRELFAAMALAGLCANTSGRTRQVRCLMAVEYADELIAALEAK